MRKRDALMLAAAGLGLSSLAAAFTDGEGETAPACEGTCEGEPVLAVDEDNYLLKVAPGETVTLHITNDSDVAHSFSVSSLGVDAREGVQELDPLALIPAFGEECFFCKCQRRTG